MTKRSAGELGLAPQNCICDPMDLAALGHMTNCPARDEITRKLSLAERIRADFQTARISRDARVGFYSTVVGEIEKVEKAALGAQASDDEVMSILKKFKKAVDDTLALPNLPADRRESYALEGRWIDAYLPALFDRAQHVVAVNEIAQTFDIPVEAKNTRQIMEGIKGLYPGQIDGKMASEVIRAGGV